MGISTKNVKKGNFISKEIKPGNRVAKINTIEIKKSDKPKTQGVNEWNIELNIETKPLGGDFVGFDKVYGDPSRGSYLGQSARVKYSNWPIKEFSWTDKKTGDHRTKDDVEQVLEAIQKICDAVGKPKWLDEVDNKYDTIEELITGFNKEKPFKDVYLSWCLAANEKIKNGYTVHYLFLPDYRTAKTVLAKEGDIVTTFDQDVHIIKDKSITQASTALEEGSDDEIEDTEMEELFDMDDEDSI